MRHNTWSEMFDEMFGSKEAQERQLEFWGGRRGFKLDSERLLLYGEWTDQDLEDAIFNQLHPIPEDDGSEENR